MAGMIPNVVNSGGIGFTPAPNLGNTNINTGAPKLNTNIGYTPTQNMGTKNINTGAPTLSTPGPGMTISNQQFGAINKSSSDQPLFHGTSAPLKPGSMITPGGFTSEEKAFATTRPETANSFAMDAAGKTTMTSNMHPQDKAPGQQALWGLVYKVKPSADMQPFKSGENAVSSKTGFEVDKLSHMIDSHGIKTDINATPTPKPKLSTQPSGPISNAQMFGKQSGI